MNLECAELSRQIEREPLVVNGNAYRVRVDACRSVDTLSTACDLFVSAAAGDGRRASVRLRLDRTRLDEGDWVNQAARRALSMAASGESTPREIEFL